MRSRIVVLLVAAVVLAGSTVAIFPVGAAPRSIGPTVQAATYIQTANIAIGTELRVQCTGHLGEVTPGSPYLLSLHRQQPDHYDDGCSDNNDATSHDDRRVRPPVTTTTVPPSSVFRLFGANSLWNTVKDPTDFATGANSTIEGATFGLNNGAYDHPFYVAKSSDPLTTFHLGAGWGNPATTIVATAPAGMVHASGGDADMDVLLTGGTAESALKDWPAGALPWAHTLLDLYGVTGSGTNWTAEYYGISDGVNGPGFSYGLGYTIGTTAIGSPQAGGTILASDVAGGAIPHGLTMACSGNFLGASSATGASDQVAPAVSNDDGSPDAGPLPEGGLLLIPAGTAVPSGLSAMGKQLWGAAATEGVYVTDTAGGDGCYFYGDGSSSVNSAFTSTDLNDVGHALELVNNW